MYNTAAVLEWTIALIFIFYVWSYVVDFLPALRSKHDRFPAAHKGASEDAGVNELGGPVFTDGGHNQANSAHPLETVPASRNFWAQSLSVISCNVI